MVLQNTDTRLTGASPYSGSLHPAKCNPGIRVEFGVQRVRPRASSALQSVAKLTLMAGIAAGILFTWQSITLNVQKFSVRQDTETPVATVVRWVHFAWKAALPQPEPAPIDAAFVAEQAMNRHALMDRWEPLITEAAKKFSVPAPWIRAVMQTESGGRTKLGAFKPITSRAGAMGLMQLMPSTYAEMRTEYRLGNNPYDPHDNIVAGVAYLRWLYHKFGYPAMFAAYNDGPGHLDDRLMKGGLLPAETRNYITHIVTALGGAGAKNAGQDSIVIFTRPNGTPVKVDLAQVTSVRVPLPGEYANGVESVITVDRHHQGVRESSAEVKKAMMDHGVLGSPIAKSPARLAALLGQHSSYTRGRIRHHARLAESGHRVRVSYRSEDRTRSVRRARS